MKRWAWTILTGLIGFVATHSGCHTDTPESSSATNWQECTTDADCTHPDAVRCSDGYCVDENGRRVELPSTDGSPGVDAGGGAGSSGTGAGGNAGSAGNSTGGRGGGPATGGSSGSATGGSGGSIGGSGGASGGAGSAGTGGAAGSSSDAGAICPDHAPQLPQYPFTPEPCSLEEVQAQLRCEYETPVPASPSVVCQTTFACRCLSDHMGGVDCYWNAEESICPDAGM